MKNHERGCDVQLTGKCICYRFQGMAVCDECGALLPGKDNVDKHASWHEKLVDDHDKIWRAGLE